MNINSVKFMNYQALPVIVVIFMEFLPSLVLGQVNLSNNEQRADSLYQNFEDQKALEVYEQILENNPENYQALWRTSFLYSRIGNRLDEEDKKQEYLKKAINFADQALKIDSTDAQSNLVMAVAMGRKALIAEPKERVAASREIKKYAERALKYDENNAGALHVLGRWHFNVANLSWLQRMAADKLFGGIPGDPSNEKAEEYIEKAISLNSDFILYYRDLARVYMEMGKDQQAINTCNTALDKPIVTPDDEQLKESCREIIEELS